MDERGLKSAVEGAIAAAGGPAAGDAAAGGQLDLLGGAPADEKRGPGRPAGRINRATEDWRNLILTRHRSPLEVLAEIMDAPTDELARKYELKPAAALSVRMRAAEALLPYVHKKMPIEVNSDGVVMPTLVVIDQFAGEAGRSGDDGLTVSLFASPKQNQGLSDAIEGEFNAEQSNGSPQAIEDASKSGAGIDNAE